jgi:hypothetical protein
MWLNILLKQPSAKFHTWILVESSILAHNFLLGDQVDKFRRGRWVFHEEIQPATDDMKMHFMF